MKRFNPKMQEKMKEALGAVMPIVAIVLVLCFTLAPVSPSILLAFLFGALLVKELIPGALQGKPWVYRASTAADCCEDAEAVAAFDAQFPPKEKGWSSTQEEFYIYSRSVVVR